MAIQIITLDTKVADIMSATDITLNSGLASIFWQPVMDMTLGDFVKNGMKAPRFGRVKYRQVIRTAVFHDHIDYNAREYILEYVI